MRRRKPMKVWRIVAAFREYYGPPEDTKERLKTEHHEIAARTLPDAFQVFSRRFRLDGLVGIGITEVKNHEEKEKKPCAGVS